MAVAIRFNHHRTCSHEKNSLAYRIHSEVRTQRSARETTEPITFSEAQNRRKLLFHMPHLFARVIVSSFSLSLSESLFLSDEDKYDQENIQNLLVKKSYILREDSDQTVRMRMLI